MLKFQALIQQTSAQFLHSPPLPPTPPYFFSKLISLSTYQPHSLFSQPPQHFHLLFFRQKTICIRFYFSNKIVKIFDIVFEHCQFYSLNKHIKYYTFVGQIQKKLCFFGLGEINSMQLLKLVGGCRRLLGAGGLGICYC